jgi:hypothetical protein
VGLFLRRAPSERVSQGMKIVDGTAMESCPASSSCMPRLPARYARTIRYTLEREHNRKVAISVGVRPAAHSKRI